jgi:hypothetical protein
VEMILKLDLNAGNTGNCHVEISKCCPGSGVSRPASICVVHNKTQGSLTPAEWIGSTGTPLFTTGTQLEQTTLVTTGLSSPPLA